MQCRRLIIFFLLGISITCFPTASAYTMSADSSLFCSLWHSSSSVEISPDTYDITYTNTGQPMQYLAMRYPSYYGNTPNTIQFTTLLTFTNLTDHIFDHQNISMYGKQCYVTIGWSNPFATHQKYDQTFMFLVSTNITNYPCGVYQKQDTQWELVYPVQSAYNITITSGNQLWLEDYMMILTTLNSSIFSIPLHLVNNLVFFAFSPFCTPILQNATLITDGDMPLPIIQYEYEAYTYYDSSYINITASHLGAKSGLYDSSGKRLYTIANGFGRYFVHKSTMYYTNETYYLLIYSVDQTFYQKIEINIIFNSHAIAKNTEDRYATIVTSGILLGCGVCGLVVIGIIRHKYMDKKTHPFRLNPTDLQSSPKIYTSTDHTDMNCSIENYQLICHPRSNSS